ncbi:DUF6057 family protein [Paraprevotella clara]|uniref:DUF6057 family protein n=1 Tax=Paraprevotella clara TaxID=454154 RepID=UPI0026667431|nr:DUF6057 family protein [Paraprevotella clara]
MNTDFSQPFNPEAYAPSGKADMRFRRYVEKGMPWFYGIVFPVILGFCLYTYEKETLFRIQELNLFLPDSTFYHTLAAYPGGTLQWAACFLTQFFYYPAVGTALLIAVWVCICFVMRSAFRLSPSWSFLPALVPAALLAGIVEMGYFIYYIKLQGYFFMASIGILAALSAVWVFSRTAHRNPYWGYAWMTVWLLAGYPLFGAYALAGTGYMVVLCWRMPGTLYKNRVIPTVWGLLLLVGVPLAAWHFYSQTAISEIYTATLPSFDAGGEVFADYRTPYYILFFLPLAGAVIYDYVPAIKKYPLILLAHLLVWAVTAWGLKKAWYVDENFRKELLMARAIEEEDWEQIPAIFLSGTAEPTRLMVMNKNLALFRLGRAGDEMFQYREGGARPNAPFLVRLAHVGGKALYYHYGQENYCYRWCMEDGVTFGWRTEYLKYMAKTSIAGGDYKVARKYIDMLKRTLFHKEWAEKYETYLDHPEQIRKSKEFAPIIRLLPKEDKLNSDLNVIEMFLLRTFAYGESDDPLYQEQTLIAALQMKDIDIFWPRFFQYATLHNGKPMPRHYQEAAYLYGHLENKVDISHMPFDQEVKDSYQRFMEFTQQCAGMTEAQMAEAFRPQFGNTFYYFYFLVNGLQTY